MTASLLALCAAVSWGAGDFVGGLTSRRAHVLLVLAVSQAVGLTGVLVWVAVAQDPFPGVSSLWPAAGAGIAGAVGLAALYRGLAIGAMGVVAPISAASPLIPLVVDAGKGIVPSAAQLAGVALVLGGIVVLSLEPSRGARLAAGAGIALIAALGFGLFVVGLDAGADESAPWAVVAARSASVALVLTVALARSTGLRPDPRLLPALVAIGLLDTGANVLIAFAVNEGSAGTVAVLSALYPITTVLLARLALGERLVATKRVGGVVAIAGAALVAAG